MWRDIFLANRDVLLPMFETLVDQGRNLESRTRRAATQTAAAAAGAAAQKAKEVHAMAGGTWDKLEQVFEDRVARALSKLGVRAFRRRRRSSTAWDSREREWIK